MAQGQVDIEILPPHPDFPIFLDGIHDGIYEQSRWYWNRINLLPHRSMFFFGWCVNNWLRYRALYELTSLDNFQHLFVRTFRYYHAMVIVGALSELETYRWDWSIEDPAARFLIGFLYRLRNYAAQEWDRDLEFDDEEQDYYSEASMTMHA